MLTCSPSNICQIAQCRLVGMTLVLQVFEHEPKLLGFFLVDLIVPLKEKPDDHQSHFSGNPSRISKTTNVNLMVAWQTDITVHRAMPITWEQEKNPLICVHQNKHVTRVAIISDTAANLPLLEKHAQEMLMPKSFQMFCDSIPWDLKIWICRRTQQPLEHCVDISS